MNYTMCFICVRAERDSTDVEQGILRTEGRAEDCRQGTTLGTREQGSCTEAAYGV
jgi:hypothetical protein